MRAREASARLVAPNFDAAAEADLPIAVTIPRLAALRVVADDAHEALTIQLAPASERIP